MTYKKILEWVPEIYHAYLPDTFHRGIPNEYLVDCFSCPMIAAESDDNHEPLSKPFSPQTKCCTFNPRIPNYLVGAILADNDPHLLEGKKRIKERISGRIGIIPNGIYPSKSYNDLFHEKRATEFGRNADLLCPYFKQGPYNCTVWKYRESICAFWFCKHLAGRSGKKMWDAVIAYLQFIQNNLLLNALLDLGLEPIDIYGNGYQKEASKEDYEDPPWYSEIWKDWEGREIEFYTKCYEFVTGIPSRTIQELHSKGKLIEKELNEKIDFIVNLPEYLVRNYKLINVVNPHTYQIEFIHNIPHLEKSVVWTMEFPCHVIDSFDGKTSTKKVLRQLELTYSLKIDFSIIISLYHHGILLPFKG